MVILYPMAIQSTARTTRWLRSCVEWIGGSSESWKPAKSIRALVETPSEAIIISSGALEGILRNQDHARIFFCRIKELNLEPKLVLFPRNQSQWINSSYSSAVKTFRTAEPFESFVLGVIQRSGVKFLRWIELAEAHAIELIARPFTKETIARSVVPEFLQALGIKSLQFRDAEVRRNEAFSHEDYSIKE